MPRFWFGSRLFTIQGGLERRVLPLRHLQAEERRKSLTDWYYSIAVLFEIVAIRLSFKGTNSANDHLSITD